MPLNIPSSFEKTPEEQLRDAVVQRAGLSEGRLDAAEPEATPGENAQIARCDNEINELIKKVGWKGPEDLVRHGRGWGLSDDAIGHVLMGQGFKPHEAHDIIFSIAKRKN